MGKELSSIQFRSLEEQLFRSMVALTSQKRQEFVVRFAETSFPIPSKTPDVQVVPKSKERVESYIDDIYQKMPFALKVLDADKVIEDRREKLEERLDEMFPVEEPGTAKRTPLRSKPTT